MILQVATSTHRVLVPKDFARHPLKQCRGDIPEIAIESSHHGKVGLGNPVNFNEKVDPKNTGNSGFKGQLGVPPNESTNGKWVVWGGPGGLGFESGYPYVTIPCTHFRGFQESKPPINIINH